MNAPTDEAIMDEVTRLPDEMKVQVLEFVRSLNSPKRALTGPEFLRFERRLDRDTVDQIAAAIEAGCEEVDHGGW